MSRRLSKAFVPLLAVLGAALLLFVLLPVLSTIFGTSPALLGKTIRDSEVLDSILLTFYAAAVATVVAALLGVPLAYLLARYEFPGRSIVEGIVDVPVVMPHTAAGIALLMVFGREGLLGKGLSRIGFVFTGSVNGIVVAMLFVSMPFMVDASKEAFRNVDPRLENVARTLGASPIRTFFTVTLPLAWRGILAGAVMMWARGISEFGSVVILTYHPMIAPVLVYDRFETFGLKYVLPVASLLILTSLGVFVLLRVAFHRSGETA